MIKFYLLHLVFLMSLNAYAETPCDIRPGTSVGIKVVEFVSGNIIHSKIPLRESSAAALMEEMVNLQDMGVCEEKIISRKCVLKYEKIKNKNYVTLYRGAYKWNTWGIRSKEQALIYTKSLKRAGFCN